MTRTRSAWAFVVVASLTAAAGDSRPPGGPAAKAVAAFRKEAGVVFKECADDACLATAYRTCSPAHLLVGADTIEGTSAAFDYFLVSEKDRCRVVKFSDFTRDYWGGCRLLKRVCPSIAAAHSDDPEGLGCAPQEVLFTAKPCSNPRVAPMTH